MSIYKTALDMDQEKTAREMGSEVGPPKKERVLAEFIEIGRAWKRSGELTAWELVLAARDADLEKVEEAS